MKTHALLWNLLLVAAIVALPMARPIQVQAQGAPQGSPQMGPGTGMQHEVQGRIKAVDPEGRIWQAIGPHRAIGCVVHPAAEIEAQGRVAVAPILDEGDIRMGDGSGCMGWHTGLPFTKSVSCITLGVANAPWIDIPIAISDRLTNHKNA